MDYKEHSDKMLFESQDALTYSNCGPLIARVLKDGTLAMSCPREMYQMNSGIKPDVALALGRWLVEMFEEKSE